MLTVGLYTLGCKVSLYETEAIAEKFVEAGFEERPFDSPCDVYVINTCTVTAESDAKSRKYIRRAIKKNPDAVVIALGCYAQRAPEQLLAIDGVDAVIGTNAKLSAVDVAKKLLFGEMERGISLVMPLEGAEFERMEIKKAPRTRAYVKIEDGCECKCTYCAISGARGPVRSKAKEDVIREVESLAAGGVSEVVLTGIETGSYGSDLGEGYGLAELLCELDKRGSCKRVRLGSMAPELVGESFAERVRGLSILVPHMHISMQSGSDAVLRSMKRRYTRERAVENMMRLRRCFPDMMFTADLMVGFPGETEEDFMSTFSFVSEVGLLDAHVFAYSKREGTPAAKYPHQLPESVKHDRSARLIAEVERVRDEVLSRVVCEGRALSSILETKKGTRLFGHTDSYIEVECECTCDRDRLGEIVSLIPLAHKNGIIYGKVIN